MEGNLITPDELESLASGVPTQEPKKQDIPTPEPEVVARAQELYKANQSNATVTTEPAVQDPIKIADKVEFLAHVLEGKEYRKSYKLLDDQLYLEFRTISAERHELIGRVMLEEDRFFRYPEESNVLRYRRMLAVASLTRFDKELIYLFNPSVSEQINLGSWQSFTRAYSKTQLQVILEAFERFDGQLQEMIRKVDDPSFW